MNETQGDSDILNKAGITKALEAVRLRISEAERARKAAEEVISVAREEERLLSRLLALRGGAPVSAANTGHEQLAPALGKGPAITAVVEELEAAGRPLHVSELMRLLQQRNVTIPGAGKQANLIAHMSRDDRIVRPTRGMYGLTSWGLESMPLQSQRRRRRRVRITTEGRRK
jgi:hypothetical protein